MLRTALCAASLLLAAALAFAQTPVKLESRVGSRGEGEAILTNLKPIPLTAYAIQIFLEPCNPTQSRSMVFRAFDSATSGKALAQDQSRTEILGSAFCNKDGVTVPARAEFRAAIFQDGSSIGDAQLVNSLLIDRRFQLGQIDIVLDRLKARDAAAMSRDVLTEDLKKRLAAASTPNTSSLPLTLDIFEMVSMNLKNGIAPTISMLEQLRARLLESRPTIQ